jgi:RimJ/RimL family protein N-acetyltransferase
MVCPPSSAPGSATLPEIETPRLRLRRLVADDAPQVRALLNEPSFLAHIGDRGVRSDEDARRYIEHGPQAMYERHGFGLWHVSLRDGGEFIGMCGLLRRDHLPAVDIGYALLPQFWGAGFAFEAASATLRQAAEKFRLPRVVAIVSPHNTGSIRLLEKLGMTYERQHLAPEGDEVALYGITLRA